MKTKKEIDKELKKEIAGLEKQFKKEWYARSHIYRQAARDFFIIGYTIATDEFVDHLEKQGEVFNDPQIKKLMGWK